MIAAMGRPFCYTCWRPRVTCLCADIRQVQNRTGITILQHPRERNHPIGTARIVDLSLRDATLLVDTVEALGQTRPPHLPADAGLLFPGEGSRDLETLPEADRPSHLVLLDGTWRHARSIYRDSAWLQAMPMYQLSPSQPSNYRIRREPKATFVSTVESAVLALRALEPETDGFDQLLAVFDAMIDRQIRIGHSERSTPRRMRPRNRERRSLPPELRSKDGRVVLVYGESLPLGESVPGQPNPRQLLQWCAVRPDTDDVFERFIADPAHPLRPGPLECMELDPGTMQHALAQTEFERDWAAFCRPDDVYAAWNQSTLDLLAALIPAGATRHLLKAIYSNLGRPHRGKVEAIADAERVARPPQSFAGRANRRIEATLGLLECIRQIGPVALGSRPPTDRPRVG